MSIVLDVNVILSALIKDSLTRKIILESGLDFYFPEVALHILKFPNFRIFNREFYIYKVPIIVRKLWNFSIKSENIKNMFWKNPV